MPSSVKYESSWEEREGKQEEIPSGGLLLLAVDYTNGTSLIFFSLGLLYL